MLRKMLFQGLFAAAVIAGSAGLYAIATAAEPARIAAAGQPTAETGAGTGYLQPGQGRPAESMRDRRESRERHEMREREKHQRSGAYVERNGMQDQDDD
ncbi:hypothetical protein [Ferrovibrio xuzhouensis]|uniref:Uncharacterized protein n=1 Tax=Ferrovibrio xuzhouensis TaxID=1576914 RepID=A0ABV7VBS6_9PROT